MSTDFPLILMLSVSLTVAGFFAGRTYERHDLYSQFETVIPGALK